MLKNNPFLVHNINYLLPSSINTYISDLPMWVARYLFKVKSDMSAGAVRGIVQEAILAERYQTGNFNYNLLEVKYLTMCTESQFDLEDTKVKKEKSLLKDFGKVIDTNFKYKNLEQYQEKVEVQLEDLPVPILGYIDFRFKDTIVDLKTTTRMPSKPTEAQKRQMAFYSMAYPKNSVDLFFATPKDYKKFTLKNLSAYQEQLKKVAFGIQKFLSISNDKHELASLVHPNYDSWTWNDNLRKEAEKIWGEYK